MKRSRSHRKLYLNKFYLLVVTNAGLAGPSFRGELDNIFLISIQTSVEYYGKRLFDSNKNYSPDCY